jgi:hypothetical protein
MDSAVSLDADTTDETLDPGSVAEVQEAFALWLEAFTGSTLSSDEAVIEDVAGIIATAEPEALEMLEERVAELLADLAAVAEETGEEITESYFAAMEGVLAAINLRLTPDTPPDHQDMPAA